MDRAAPRPLPAGYLAAWASTTAGIAMAATVAVVTLPRLPHVSPWPIGALHATGHRVGAVAALGALGAAQLVGFLPGPDSSAPA